ncbi:hypothetical protein [Aureimonas phyllosphaerae]|uniref:Uncharacterized protein n=1 Tax=Aureimonas phyllosphaerae TaxID=1166078 RepID=A0A7W6BWB5_9HYPH|nr:hypothetical protein [Aureimonas phyllosphaerae]MBB3938107.1 hypothetical protein [Aureimonas phyllosphaerae]MBB3962114.1 hypothetical protein [Aureimonas phyllosphaerae]
MPPVPIRLDRFATVAFGSQEGFEGLHALFQDEGRKLPTSLLGGVDPQGRVPFLGTIVVDLVQGLALLDLLKPFRAHVVNSAQLGRVDGICAVVPTVG